MFLDASAMLAILLREPDAGEYLARLEGATKRVYTSPIARFEAIVSLARAKTRPGHTSPDLIDAATALVDRFLEEIPAQIIAISPDMGQRAVEAAARYGKIVGHPARLNLGDCFAYAAAETYRLPLLYKGDDFAATDMAGARGGAGGAGPGSGG